VSTYLLVHGGWHGGWYWSRVTSILREAGHEVFTPTLTGLGERAHLLSPEIDLDTHIRDILGVMKYEDLHDLILVGHSYAGMIITAVAEQASERLRHLVYLDAFIPQNGESLIDVIGADFAAIFRERVQVDGDGWRLPPLPLEVLGITEEADKLWISPKLTDQPFKAFSQPVRLKDEAAAGPIPRTFIYCNNPAIGPYDRFAEKARREGWRYRELATGHFPMVTAPRRTADLLLEVA
jgi:Predicted hydrolases or acyltransferases (alpha/beta hydrolase superfamily)